MPTSVEEKNLIFAGLVQTKPVIDYASGSGESSLIKATYEVLGSEPALDVIGWSRFGQDFPKQIIVSLLQCPASSWQKWTEIWKFHLESPHFEPPQPVERYPEYMDATKYRPFCLQRRTVLGAENIGSEDCLYLNIYIPQIPTKGQKLKAVIFSIYGGAFIRGRTHWYHHYPTTLMEYDVIYVTFVYRLHILGFLNLGLSECPGNVGLKDQAAALKWVVANIHLFGGDPNNITAYGTSSGATSAAFLNMSPLTQGLFKKAIITSPVSIYPWNFEERPVERAFKFGHKLGFHGTDKKGLLNFFKKLPAEDIFNAIYDNYNTEFVEEVLLMWGAYMFRPSVEFIKEGAFLPDTPYKLWENVNLSSVICGACVNEGVLFFNNKTSAENLDNVDAVKNIIKVLVRDSFHLNEEECRSMCQEIEGFYFEGGKTDLSPFKILMDVCSDYSQRDNYVIYNYMRKPEIDFTYNYLFTYEGSLNIVKNRWASRFPAKIDGTYHSDEYGYFIETPTKVENGVPNENDLKVMRSITSMFTNFAKTGNPNCEEVGCQWKPTSEENQCYLEIDADLKLVQKEMLEERIKFWKYLMQKYCSKTLFS